MAHERDKKYLNADFLLLELFDDFYQAVGEIKIALSASGSSEALGKYLNNAPIAPGSQAECISDYLFRLLQNQQQIVEDIGTPSDIKAFNRAKYFMSALADELFLLVIDWGGQDDWLDYMLEMKLFGTALAGNRFYEYIQEILNHPRKSANDTQLAAIALLALRLGFKGVYRRDSGDKQLNVYKSRLFRLVGDTQQSDDRLFPEADRNILNPSTAGRLAPLSRWHRICLLAVCVYLFASTILWVFKVAPLRSLMSA